MAGILPPRKGVAQSIGGYTAPFQAECLTVNSEHAQVPYVSVLSSRKPTNLAVASPWDKINTEQRHLWHGKGRNWYGIDQTTVEAGVRPGDGSLFRSTAVLRKSFWPCWGTPSIRGPNNSVAALITKFSAPSTHQASVGLDKTPQSFPNNSHKLTVSDLCSGPEFEYVGTALPSYGRQAPAMTALAAGSVPILWITAETSPISRCVSPQTRSSMDTDSPARCPAASTRPRYDPHRRHWPPPCSG